MLAAMSIRRTLRGSPLLVSAAGAVVTIACSHGQTHVGNLMAPPMVRVCVTSTPPAPVIVNGNAVDEDGCTSVYEGATVSIDATLDGYQPYHEDYAVEPTAGPHEIVLVPAEPEPAPEE
jgi:hypothetical protein